MKNLTREQRNTLNRSKILHTAAKLFLEKGYTATSLKEICSESGVNLGTLVNLFECKENIMRDLVRFVLEGQFSAAKRMIKGKTEDRILFYAAETTLQLHMAESSEHIRELYSVAYSLPNSSEVIYHTITGKLEQIFKESLPQLETKDFYELEIASGGIMRGFMTVPCDMYFTMERKVKRFLETTFLVYRVSDEKIKQAIEFVEQFDFVKAAQDTINNLLAYLERNT